MNTWGRLLRLTTWGESHGEAIGGVLDGFPPGIVLDIDQVQHELERRAPGRSDLTSPRREPDKVHILSGVYEGKTTGAPIAIVIYNEDQRSRDYSELARLFRPGHADYTYQMKYGHRDPRGGGRASARETAIRVAAGAIVRQWLQGLGIEIVAYTTQVGSATCDDASTSWSDIYAQRHTPLRCPDPEAEEEMQALIRSARDEGDSVGGIVVCRAIGLPVGLGEPLYDKLSARLAYAMMSINAVRGFEIGDGFALGGMYGSQSNDLLRPDRSMPTGVDFSSNHCGGILGGISTGGELRMRLVVKPTPSIQVPQMTVDIEGQATSHTITGRHDPCIVPRVLPVIEAMCALTLGDMLLLAQRPDL